MIPPIIMYEFNVSIFKFCIIFPHAALLNPKGLEWTDIILVHLYMKNMKDFEAINSAYMTAFDLYPPARWVHSVVALYL